MTTLEDSHAQHPPAFHLPQKTEGAGAGEEITPSYETRLERASGAMRHRMFAHRKNWTFLFQPRCAALCKETHALRPIDAAWE
jgi:hypothetical protein